MPQLSCLQRRRKGRNEEEEEGGTSLIESHTQKSLQKLLSDKLDVFSFASALDKSAPFDVLIRSRFFPLKTLARRRRRRRRQNKHVF